MNTENGFESLTHLLTEQVGGIGSDAYLDVLGWRRDVNSLDEIERRFSVLSSDERSRRERILRELDRLALKYAGVGFAHLCAQPNPHPKPHQAPCEAFTLSQEASVGTTDSLRRHQVFISYSHKDKAWLQKLQTMLRPLEWAGRISCWDDTRLDVGRQWKEEIGAALKRARVAVLLVSPDFLASEFIATHELPVLLNAARNNGLAIVWISLRPCLFEETEIGAYQAANDPHQPLSSLDASEQERCLVAICRRILKLAAS